jgi:uncharacterized protein YjdB
MRLLLSHLLVLALMASACSGASTQAPTPPTPNPTISSATGTGFLMPGQVSQLTATQTLSTGLTQDVTTLATWQSSNSRVATVSNAGLVTAVAAGTATITATYLGGMAGTLVLVVNALVTAVLVAGPNSLGSAQTSQLSAAATLRDGMTQIVTNAAAWQSSNPSVATVSSAGLLTAVAPGTTTITATYQGMAGTLAMTVNNTVVSILVLGTTQLTASSSQTGQFVASAMMSSGPEQLVTAIATWVSSNPAVATVSSTGLVTAVAAGTTTITATYHGVTGALGVTVM